MLILVWQIRQMHLEKDIVKNILPPSPHGNGVFLVIIIKTALIFKLLEFMNECHVCMLPIRSRPISTGLILFVKCKSDRN